MKELDFMLSIKFPNLNIDADVSIDEKGLNVEVKKFNINNFTIDKVFKYIDKKYGRKNKDKIEDKKVKNISSDDSGEYLIKIE